MRRDKRPAAIGTWASMVGAMILARVSDKPEFSDEVLRETRAWLAAQDRRTPKPDVRAKRKGARHTGCERRSIGGSLTMNHLAAEGPRDGLRRSGSHEPTDGSFTERLRSSHQLACRRSACQRTWSPMKVDMKSSRVIVAGLHAQGQRHVLGLAGFGEQFRAQLRASGTRRRRPGRSGCRGAQPRLASRRRNHARPTSCGRDPDRR